MNHASTTLCLASLAALTAVARAEEPASPLAAYAEAIARGDFAAAYAQLSEEDARRVSKEAFVARFQALAAAPWTAVVLRSARVAEGRLTAIDWTYTRFARAGLLADPAILEALPRRTYLEGAALAGGRLHAGVYPENVEEAGSAEVVAKSRDWFGLYATFTAHCSRAVRFLLVELSSEGERGAAVLDCDATGPEELLVWLDRDPKPFATAPLTARILARAPRGIAPDPFRAPPAELAGHPAFVMTAHGP